jgi:hypothetical protein
VRRISTFRFEDPMNVSIRLLAVGLFLLALAAGCDNGKSDAKPDLGNDKATNVQVKSGKDGKKKLPPVVSPGAPP